MNAIKAKIAVFAAASSLMLIVTLVTAVTGVDYIDTFFKDVVSTVHVSPIFILALIVFFILLGFLIIEYGKYKDAKLITENEIMHIQVAKIEYKVVERHTGFLLADTLDVVISCFGILLDSKVIKFNIDEIAIKRVEIGREFISFIYGSDEKTQRLRILHGDINKRELQDFVDRFRHETGVIPEVDDTMLV